MNFVLDASVAMCWILLHGKTAERAYARKVPNLMKQSETSAVVPMTSEVEVANVIGTAEMKGLVTEAQNEAFLEMLVGIDIRGRIAPISTVIASSSTASSTLQARAGSSSISPPG